MEVNVKFAVAGDHAGCQLKELLVEDLIKQGHEVLDLGAHEVDPADDYPDFAEKVALTLLEERAERGVLVCGSGVGVCIAANKFPGVRAGVCHDTYSVRQGVQHDNMNVLCLGGRVVGPELACEILRAFASARFTAGERHLRRLRKVLAIESRYLRSEEAAGKR
jgi:RpiB/LacA/LacB family sugar-phosphate isomerase